MSSKNAEEQEEARKQTNAKKAKEAADLLFPDEKWIKFDDGIYFSPRRPVGEKSNFSNELRDAQILQSFGSTIYLVPEDSREEGKKYDAIVNGQKMEFKNMRGMNERTLKKHFLKSRQQAPNVFINLENSTLARHDIISYLYGARNSADWEKYNSEFNGGKIILKIQGHKNLIYLNVDALKLK
jgi:hypothetical protein